jgi:hypothetical protein
MPPMQKAIRAMNPPFIAAFRMRRELRGMPGRVKWNACRAVSVLPFWQRRSLARQDN